MFLETITALDHDVLIPIARIKYLFLKYVSSEKLEIRIETDDGSWIECFTNEKKAIFRYNMIKKILNGK